MAGRKERLIDIFRDTQLTYVQHPVLKKAISNCTPELIPADVYPDMPSERETAAVVKVTKSKSFESAMENHRKHPEWKITVLNFASAMNPGGGVKTGSSAQEESLCRCSTLYPALLRQSMWDAYYSRNREMMDPLHTDDCIYTPGIIIFKTDDDYPKLMPESDWVAVDVISCAAPNLRRRPGNSHNPEYGRAVIISDADLYNLHLKRAKHIMHIAAANGANALVLGAFGCGAFANDPMVVAEAYRDALAEYRDYFRLIEFAVYCRPGETANYDAFREMII